jgi:hypothetical protein
MVAYLNHHNVPYDGIDYSKQHFRVVIDDKCLGSPLDSNKNVDWTKARELLKNMGVFNALR